VAIRKATPKSGPATPAKPKAGKVPPAPSPESEMGAEDESLSDASHSKGKSHQGKKGQK
jgi:hypothetical protein